MPRDIEKLVRQRYPEELAEKIIKDFSTYKVMDWSEASQRQIDRALEEVANYIR